MTTIEPTKEQRILWKEFQNLFWNENVTGWQSAKNAMFNLWLSNRTKDEKIDMLATERNKYAREYQSLFNTSAEMLKQDNVRIADLTGECETLAAINANLEGEIKGLDADKLGLTDQIAGLTIKLNNLLAVIHRDGGQTVEELGLTTAYETGLTLSSERIAQIADLIAQRDRAWKALEIMCRPSFTDAESDLVANAMSEVQKEKP